MRIKAQQAERKTKWIKSLAEAQKANKMYFSPLETPGVESKIGHQFSFFIIFKKLCFCAF